ncbi:hypothetical protein CGLO_15352 [Colletotrichum gloeosporioides Cg-14]|uniref:ToxB-like N-terminal ascomycota domain-containing protein n=1 Tax=Colletotrichum gloeosporioides (strain Cg-14) TaxID=1237896 RepID=T0LBR9_COLGC|nr:hypothetical protein CGLO_15352 [Colletotrichum gloeosporioides Cg-14]
MRLAQVTASAALFAGVVFARQDACSIELLNVNQAVVDTKCIPFDTTTAMKDPTGPGGGQLYKVHVNNLCGIGLDDGQELANGASLRKLSSPFGASRQTSKNYQPPGLLIHINIASFIRLVDIFSTPNLGLMAPKSQPGSAKPVYGRTLAGKILWLPKKEEISPSLDTDLSPGVYNHPVLILSHKPRDDGTVRALTMTSANGRNITEDMAFHWKFREKYLPVAPTPPHADSGLQLHLAGASPSNKAYRPAYVMLQGGPYTIHRDVLRAHQSTSLSSRSFGILVTEMGYTEEEDYLKEQRAIERKKRKIEKDAEKEKRRALWDQGVAESKRKAEEKREQRQVVKKEKADERMARKIQRMAVKERDMAKVNTKLDKGFFCLMAGIFVAILCLEALFWYGFWLAFGFW